MLDKNVQDVGGSSRGNAAGDISYQAMPQNISAEDEIDPIVWRVRFEIAATNAQEFGVAIYDEIVFGRASGETEANLIDLSPYDASQNGVSRHHLLLRPTATHLFAIDLDSTNGTMRNGRSIGRNIPTRVLNGDTLTLGTLQINVYVDYRPAFTTSLLQPRPSLEEAMSEIAKAITSQLNLDEVLNQVAETAMVLSNAGETGIWLVNEESGELQLEAHRGLSEDDALQTSLPIREDNMVGNVLRSGKPIRVTHRPGEDKIKIKTDYMVEALVYVPIILGGVALGVVAAAHREKGKQFSKQDEKLLVAIADFAAIAIQNARLYEATDNALARRVNELASLNEVSRVVTSSLDINHVYDVLVEQVNKNWTVAAVQLYLQHGDRRWLQPLRQPDNNSKQQIAEGVIWQAAQDGRSLFVNDVDANPDYVKQSDAYPGLETKSLACVPLRVKEEIVGVLVLFNKTDEKFNREDINRLEAFANPVATALENARLFAESEQQRLAIQATAQTLTEPLLILDDQGEVLVANDSARKIIQNHMAQLLSGLSEGVGKTTEMSIGENVYLATIHHVVDVGTITVMQDITYVKQLEYDRAEFMHALSHDLKSPLTSIRGFAQLLDHVVDLKPRSAYYIEQIVNASDRMLDMINQLLQLAIGEEIPLEKQPCRLQHVLANIVKDVEGAALYKKIGVHFNQVGSAYMIMADETRLYHMVLNVVDNAIKYSPINTNVYVNLTYAEDIIEIRVRDEGPGIPQADLNRIFEKFYRGVQSNVTPGAGMGLSFVAAIARAHDGSVSVDNHPDGGAVFSIVLPASLRLPQIDN